MSTKLALYVRNEANSLLLSFKCFAHIKIPPVHGRFEIPSPRSVDWRANITPTRYTDRKCDLLLIYWHIHSYRYHTNN